MALLAEAKKDVVVFWHPNKPVRAVPARTRTACSEPSQLPVQEQSSRVPAKPDDVWARGDGVAVPVASSPPAGGYVSVPCAAS